MKKNLLILSMVLMVSSGLYSKTYQSFDTVDTKFDTSAKKQKLFKSVGCEYFNDMQILDSNFETNKTEGVIRDSKTAAYLKDIKKRTLAPMYLKFINHEIGYGIFALKPIKKGEFIGVYAGQVRVVKGTGDDVDYAWYYPINAHDGSRMVIDGKFKGNELRFINHSEHPNTECRHALIDGIWYMYYVATQDIKQGYELTVSYGGSYWNSRNIVPA
jgi:SET domain-containing protein